MRACRYLSYLLYALDVTKSEASIIPLDFTDHEEWMYVSYKVRVGKREQEKSGKTS